MKGAGRPVDRRKIADKQSREEAGDGGRRWVLGREEGKHVVGVEREKVGDRKGGMDRKGERETEARRG